jgi:hypothetical protein
MIDQVLLAELQAQLCQHIAAATEAEGKTPEIHQIDAVISEDHAMVMLYAYSEEGHTFLAAADLRGPPNQSRLDELADALCADFSRPKVLLQ